jgi:glycosyltransferase involved in cell wall biosynthesis
VRLVVYLESDKVGGSEIATGLLVEALRPDIEVVAMGPYADVIEWIGARRAGSRAVVVPRLRSKWELAAYPRHRALLREFAPAVFQAVLIYPTACQWPLLAAASVPGIAPVAVEHLMPLPTSRRGSAAKRRTVRRLAAHVAVSERVARATERQFGLASGSVRTIYNGVPDLAVVPTTLAADGPCVGTTARFHELKGLDVLLRAVAGLGDVHAFLVGQGPEEVALRALATNLGIEDRVHFHGWTNEPRAYLAAFDVVAVPSRQEAVPLTLVEAMLAARPVVASAVGGIPEVIEDGTTGVLIPPDDPAALAAALSRLLADPDLRREMGARARATALRQFSMNAMVQAYESLYGEVLRDRIASTS